MSYPFSNSNSNSKKQKKKKKKNPYHIEVRNLNQPWKSEIWITNTPCLRPPVPDSSVDHWCEREARETCDTTLRESDLRVWERKCVRNHQTREGEEKPESERDTWDQVRERRLLPLTEEKRKSSSGREKSGERRV